MRFYVDGSWDEKNKIGAWSVVQVVGGRPNKILSGRVYGRDITNTDVELIAAMKALEYAKKQNHKKITLFHDYTGTAGVAIGNWVTKSETARQSLTALFCGLVARNLAFLRHLIFPC